MHACLLLFACFCISAFSVLFAFVCLFLSVINTYIFPILIFSQYQEVRLNLVNTALINIYKNGSHPV